jgi:hypothetical protein
MMKRTVVKRTAFLVPMLIVVAACATVPRAIPVQDVKDLAGNWEARLRMPLSDAHNEPSRVRLNVKEDGSYTATTQFLGSLLGEPRTLAPSFRTIRGVIHVNGGQAVYQPDRAATGGVVTLFDRSGKRVLRFASASADGPVDFTSTE